MLVTFKSRASGDIVMFGDVAKQLLTLMGQSGEVPGAILANDVNAALKSLETGLAARPDANTESSDDDDDDEAQVSLHTRAVPLVQLLEAASADNADVMWEAQ